MHVEMLADVSRVGPLADFKEVVGEAQSTEGAMKMLFFCDRRMSSLFAFKQRASAKSQV